MNIVELELEAKFDKRKAMQVVFELYSNFGAYQDFQKSVV